MKKYLRAIQFTYEHVKSQPRTEAGNFWHKLIYPHQVWLDGIYMMQPFYTRYETMYNNKINYDDIVGQIKLVKKIMYDEKSNLYYHAYDESKSMFWANKETGLSKHFWLRAIGWYLAGIIDVYSYMEDESLRKELSEILKTSVDGLLRYQDESSKMFYQIVDLKDRSPNYLETSGSLLASYAILKGSRLGALPESYSNIGEEIFEGVVSSKLTEVDGGI